MSHLEAEFLQQGVWLPLPLPPVMEISLLPGQPVPSPESSDHKEVLSQTALIPATFWLLTHSQLGHIEPAPSSCPSRPVDI